MPIRLLYVDYGSWDGKHSSKINKINSGCSLMTECVSSVLLLGRASKHTVLSVKIEDYEPLVAVP